MKLRNTNGTCAYRQPEAVDSQEDPWLALEEEWLSGLTEGVTQLK